MDYHYYVLLKLWRISVAIWVVEIMVSESNQSDHSQSLVFAWNKKKKKTFFHFIILKTVIMEAKRLQRHNVHTARDVGERVDFSRYGTE